jgi:hypothetical protein
MSDLETLDQERERLAFPLHPSNRSVINRMKEWGWVVVRERGDRWALTLPGVKTVTVNAPTFHENNRTPIMREVVAATCGGDHSLFWNASPLDIEGMKRPEPTVAQVAAILAAPDTVSPPPAKEPAMPTEAPPVTGPPPHVPLRGTSEADPTKPPRTRQHGHTEIVLNYLLSDGHTHTTGQIAEATGLSRDRVNKAAGYLVNVGAARRIKVGVYQVSDATAAAARVEVTHHDHHEEAFIGNPVPVVRESPAVVTVEWPADTENEVLDVLDLLLPDGFKAKHLPAIEEWKAATVRLLREVRS